VEKLRNESFQLRKANQLTQSKEKMIELSAFMKDHKIGVGRLLGLGLLPVPFFISTFFALQKLATQPIPSMTREGIFWFQDLTLADPYYILPALTTLSLLASLEVQFCHTLDCTINHPLGFPLS
jgi:YidC/Oxa1 family membrane protein insertase